MRRQRKKGKDEENYQWHVEERIGIKQEKQKLKRLMRGKETEMSKIRERRKKEARKENNLKLE